MLTFKEAEDTGKEERRAGKGQQLGQGGANNKCHRLDPPSSKASGGCLW